MDVSTVVKLVFAVLGAVLTGVLLPWLRARTTQMQRDRLAGWVRVAVMAAEQIFSSAEGAEKKAYALAWLHDIGVDVTDMQIDAMIESAVYELTK